MVDSRCGLHCTRCEYKVFRLCMEGKGNETIARQLQNEKVLVPQAYWQSKGLGKGGNQPGNARKNEKRRRNRIKRRARENLHGTRLHDG